MKARETTKYWEELKNKNSEGLFYSKERGIYIQTIMEGIIYDELLFRPHGYVGFYEESKEIPEKNIRIKIKTNFGYEGRSYHRAIIEKNNQRLLDFDVSKVYILNNCSVGTFDVSIYDWKGLFDKIINACDESFAIDSSTSISNYLDEITGVLNNHSIFVKKYYNNIKSFSRWDGDLLVSLLAGMKIQDLLKGIEMAKISDPKIMKETLQLCKHFISKLKSQSFTLEDSRLFRISDILLTIHEFMLQNKKGAEYLEYIFNASCKF